MPGSRISLAILGANGRVGRLLRAHWASAPPPGITPIWQSREPLGPGGIGWSLADGPAALAARLGTGVDVLLVLAGVTPGAAADLSDNAALALAALQAAQKAGVAHVFLASSAAVYGLPPDAAPLPETAALAPVTPYGAAKMQMEQAVAGWQGTGLTILRIGNVAGTDQLFRVMLTARPEAPLLLDRFADGQTPSRSYVGPASLARILERLAPAAMQGALPRILNIGAPGSVSMASLIAAMARAGHPVPHRFRTAPPQALRALHLDTSLLQRTAPLSTAQADALVAEWLALRGQAA